MDDYYAILGVSSDATLDEIKKAYRAQLKLYHPDLHGNEDPEVIRVATEMTRKVDEAYNALIEEKTGTGGDKPGQPREGGAADVDRRNSVGMGGSLAGKLARLRTKAKNGGKYMIELNADESIPPKVLKYEGISDITIMLRGVGASRVVSLSYDGAMFTVEQGVTLILDSNVTLKGRENNKSALIHINKGGTLVMNDGSVITGNAAKGNGGGVLVNGTFSMSGGLITGNTAKGHGGGAAVYEGTFSMSGGSITGNAAEHVGGGVLVSGTFNMSGGFISGNTAGGSGGGVDVDGTFNMSGGSITGNTTKGYGGGVLVSGILNIRGGLITGNTAGLESGGVLVRNGIFIKSGGTITGYASDRVNGNAVKNSSGVPRNGKGHAVSAYSSAGFYSRKETTAGPGDDLFFNSANGEFTGNWD